MMQDKIEVELARAEQEGATGYLTSDEFIPFCELAVSRGYGISHVEAFQSPKGTVRRNHGYEILGVDQEENWREHRDPQRSLRLAKEKLAWAREDGADFIYMVWIDVP